MIPFTPDQRQAIEAVSQDVVVTAAAGSGKTAVLAERCAHLVCDAEEQHRCDVDELLVVTFTEAAAAEMKSRINAAIRTRAKERPGDARLGVQAALVDTARISTIHAFCRWVLRRWFNEAAIDPTAPLLDADEARLLRIETLDRLFNELYTADDPLARGFRKLVDDYGLGEDRALGEFILKLADFLDSLPDPPDWIAAARRSVTEARDDVVRQINEQIAVEIARQIDHVASIVEHIRRHLPEGAFYAGKIEQYENALHDWSDEPVTDELRSRIAAFDLNARGAPRKPQDPTALARREEAAGLFQDVRDKLLRKRLQAMVRFATGELLEGLQQIAPYVETTLDLVERFRRRYRSAKKSLDTLDFSDLERGAYDLLTTAEAGSESPVARELRDRFRYVLVDEFQDINPLQAAILECTSRHSDPDRPNNLFCVGDVKQSIYRFRLAEPEIFQHRVEQAMEPPDSSRPDTAGDESRGAPALCVRLQQNFRSDDAIISGVNLLFERLMTRQMGGVDYDHHSRLHTGKAAPGANPAAAPIELHLIQRQVARRDHDDDAGQDNGGDLHPPRPDQPVDPDDPAVWEAIEREAHLIGRRLHQLRDSGLTIDGQPPEWRDVAILLASARHTAAPLADMLATMGIPARTVGRGSLTNATEIRDLLALLNVLDNPLQDIPLAAVLRSGVTGLTFSEDDLVAIRCLDRDIPFHEAVRVYAEKGADHQLRERLEHLYRQLARWRQACRLSPLPDVLWQIYRESGYLAWVGGLTRGALRRANLIALHERARQFSRFHRQGLFRFLRFIESLDEAEQELQSGPPTADADNAVTIMTIHGSKGLEFPVVLVADLGRKFNFLDARGAMVFDRHTGLGFKVCDPRRMIQYPSALHMLAKSNIESGLRQEYLRLMYVAFTRARNRLILIGSTDIDAAEKTRSLHPEPSERVSALVTESAGTPLDWLIPALAVAPPGTVAWPGQPPANAQFHVQYHREAQMQDWHMQAAQTRSPSPTLAAAATLQELPPGEPHGGPAAAQALLHRVITPYPHLAAASVPAVVSASEAKRAYDPFVDEFEPPPGPRRPPTFEAPSLLNDPAGHLSPADVGTLTHRLLQELDFAAPTAAQIDPLVQAGLLTRQQADAVNVADVEWFRQSELGTRIRTAGPAYRREFMFIQTEPAHLFDPATEGIVHDRPLVRGIVDGILPAGKTLEVIDYKTDRITPQQTAARAAEYGMQMNIYVRAVSNIWHQPVSRAWLAFLSARCVVEVNLDRHP